MDNGETTKRGKGRPRNERGIERGTFTLYSDQKALIEAAAGKRGVSESEVIRDLLDVAQVVRRVCGDT